MPRLCISIPVHEQLSVVADQVENIRAFTPDDTLIVIHAADGFLDNFWLQSVMPEGVYVNPKSVVNDWGFEVENHGTVIPQHQSNFRYMTEVVKEPFDYFLLEASNDLFFMSGVADYIDRSGADAGVQSHPITPHTKPGTLFEMAEQYGVEVRNSQVEGQFYKTDVYRELIDKVDAQWGPESRMVAAEEWWYPTIIQAITSNTTAPYVYTETHWDMARHRPSPVLIDALRDRTYAEDLIADLRAMSNDDPSFDYPAAFENDFENVYAIKRVPRVYDDVLRTYIRGLARQHQPFLKFRQPDDFASFNACITVNDALNHPESLQHFARCFSAADDVALVAFVPSDQQHLLPQLEVAVKEAGLDAPNSADVVAYIRNPSPEEEAYLSRVIDVMITERPLSGPLGQVLQVKPVYTERLRLIADRKVRSSR